MEASPSEQSFVQEYYDLVFTDMVAGLEPAVGVESGEAEHVGDDATVEEFFYHLIGQGYTLDEIREIFEIGMTTEGDVYEI